MGTAAGLTQVPLQQQPPPRNDLSLSAHKNAVMIAACGASYLTPFMVSSVNIALPTIGRELSIGAVQLSWITTAYLLCSTIFLIPLGRLADIYGRRRFFSTGILIATVSALCSALSVNGTQLILSRIVHGIGAAMIFGTGMAMLTSAFPATSRGKVLGLNTSFVYLGLSTGPSIGGILIRYFGWQTIFLSVIPVGIAIFISVQFGIKSEWKLSKKTPFDAIGAVLYGIALTILMIGFTRLTHTTGKLYLILGTICAILFIIYELRISHPVLPLSLFFKNRLFSFSNLTAFITYSATYAVGFLVSFYLQYIKEMSPAQAGLFMIIQPVIMVLGSPLSGKLSDTYEPRIISSAGMVCSTTGLLLLSTVASATTLPHLGVILGLLGFGFALFSSPNMSAVMGSVDKMYYGTASATVGTMRLSGQVVSMGCISLLISLLIGDGQITPERYQAFLAMMHTASRLFAVICGVGIIMSVTRGNVHTHSK